MRKTFFATVGVLLALGLGECPVAIAQFRTCAKEGEYCKCYGKVRYGKWGHYLYNNVKKSSHIGCDNSWFKYSLAGKTSGDPMPGHKKTCQCIIVI